MKLWASRFASSVGHFSCSSNYLDQRVLFKPLCPLLWCQHSSEELGMECRVHHYSFGRGWCSWGAIGLASGLSLRRVSTSWWHNVIYYWYFYLVGFRFSDHLSRVDRDSLSLFSNFLPFHLAYLSYAHHSFGVMCVFVCSCFWCSYEFSSSFHSLFDWGS